MSIRSLTCAVIGALSVVVLLLLTPHQSLAPKGVVLPTTEKTFSAVSPDQVVIYHQAPSQNYTVVAQIRAEKAFGQSAHDELIRYVKTLAASAGANGVIVQFFVPDNGVQKAYTFVGQAIRLSSPAAVKKGVGA